MIHLTIYGEPVAQGHRQLKNRQGQPITVTKDNAAAQIRRIQEAWLSQDRPSLSSPYGLVVKTYRTRPKAARKRPAPTTRPDVKNELALVEDALKGLAFRDDAEIVWVIAQKRYADDSPPRTEIILWGREVNEQ